MINIDDVVNNVEVAFLDRSIRGSKFPFAVDVSKCTEELTDRQINLAHAPSGSGHDNFLKGIIVACDVTFPNKVWVEAERYHWFDIVSSQSTMHKVDSMDFKTSCNEYVTDNTLNEIERLLRAYNEDKTADNYLRLLYNTPSGLKLTADCRLNYLQLKTIYRQRREHRLPEWRVFCKWIKTLPNSFLITGEE